MMAILTTLGHDAAYRFGLISDGIILVHAGTVAVIFCVGTLYISVVARSRSQLAANNLILEKERLQSQAMMKVHSELHDGVLNYLSIVNILSQEKPKTALADIQKLSRFAINEVRVILGQRAHLMKIYLLHLEHYDSKLSIIFRTQRWRLIGHFLS